MEKRKRRERTADAILGDVYRRDEQIHEGGDGLVHLLTEARDAYQAAMTASTALRNSLEAGDQALRSLMTRMEPVVDAHLGEPSTRESRKH